MIIEITLEELTRIVYALQQQVLKEAEISIDLSLENRVSILYSNLADKVNRQRKEQKT